jgi:hypothetical protein
VGYAEARAAHQLDRPLGARSLQLHAVQPEALHAKALQPRDVALERVCLGEDIGVDRDAWMHVNDPLRGGP